MPIKVLLLCNIVLVLGYNVDTKFRVLYSLENGQEAAGAYFGYSVLLHYDAAKNTSWLIIGAPRAGYYSFKNASSSGRFGVLYRSIIGGASSATLPEKIPSEQVFVERFELKMIIKKEESWFGAAMSIKRSNGLLTVCAPRTIVTILNPSKDMHIDSIDTMQGICYSGSISSDTLKIEGRELSAYDFSTPFWYNPLHGFSVHYATAKHNEDDGGSEINRIIGEPKHEVYGTVKIQHAQKRVAVDLPDSDDLAQFGYSVTSGYFFKKDQLLYAAGAPGWQYVGQVGIIDPLSNSSIVSTVRGNEIGEYFGASLATGDLNGDGLDDLVVGAPYWGYDSGKLYLFLGTAKGQFEMAGFVEGSVEGSHFGYALACGDLDSDGFADVIVGAPWEEEGVIYIYNGAASLKDEKMVQLSQRISGVELSKDLARPVERFGFSISEPIDVDQNGYPDVAVGAYKSGHAAVLYSKPVAKTVVAIQTIPTILRWDAREFFVEVCVTYYDYDMPNMLQEFKITMTVDGQHQRTRETTLELKSSKSLPNACVQTNVTILENIQDFVEPIALVARHDFVYNNDSNKFCKTCPVERKGNKLKVARALLPFDIGCGEDLVCNSNILASAKFHGVRDNDTWVVGANDISLEVNFKNDGEQAYLTSLVFAIPEGIILRSLLPSCQEDTTANDLLVVCDAGNPLGESEERTVKLDLDMRRLNRSSLHNSTLDFHVEIKTTSINHGTAELIKTLNLVSEVSLSLNGKANDESYYLPVLNDDTPNVTFQHTYQVYKLGSTPVEEAKLIIKVPVSMRNSNPLVYVYEPKVYILGKISKCTSIDAVLLEAQTNHVQEETLYDQFNLSARMTQDPLETPARKRRAVYEEKSITREQYLITSLDRGRLFNESENITESEIRKSEFVARNMIYMNCSTRDVSCATLFCDLSALKTLQDVARIPVKLVLDVGLLRDSFARDRKILKFDTEARVEIVKPSQSLFIEGTRSTMEVATLFYNTPKMKKLQLWIVLVSVTVGLLLLCVCIVILRKLGFFKRSGKQNFTSLNSNQVTDEETKESVGISKVEST